MKKIQTIILVFYNIILFGQTDSICRCNTLGKKVGYCKVYLDDKAMPTDSANSYFWGYEFYDEGKAPFPRFKKERDINNYNIKYDGELPRKGSPRPIEGTLKWYTKTKGHEEIYLENKYMNGYAQIFKQYNSEGIAWVTIDFTKLYNDISGTLWLEYAEGGMILKFKKGRKFWGVKKGNKWAYIRAN